LTIEREFKGEPTMAHTDGRKPISRRTFLQSAAWMMGGGVLAACAAPAAQAPTGGEAAQGEAAPAADVVTISFMGWGGPGEDEGVRNAIAVFEEEQPGIAARHQGYMGAYA
jgi:ABC-type glycerol-3-phosphate transport system substrate-binding protein